MKFKINNRSWEIIETNQAKMHEIENTKEETGINYFGLTCYDTQIIYLWQDLHIEQKRQTLIHELFHCYIGTYVSFQDMTYTEDMICNLVGNSHDIIHEIVENYFKEKENG